MSPCLGARAYLWFRERSVEVARLALKLDDVRDLFAPDFDASDVLLLGDHWLAHLILHGVQTRLQQHRKLRSCGWSVQFTKSALSFMIPPSSRFYLNKAREEQSFTFFSADATFSPDFFGFIKPLLNSESGKSFTQLSSSLHFLSTADLQTFHRINSPSFSSMMYLASWFCTGFSPVVRKNSFTL